MSNDDIAPDDNELPPSLIDPLNGALLALHAMREGGQEPVIISHNDYWALDAEEQRNNVHLVLQNETYKLWRERYG